MIDASCQADFTVLDAPTPKDAVLSRSDKLPAHKAGRVVKEKAGRL
ncbi:MAG: hypothetical protein AAGU74_04115 [Bacillota bacterium]